MISGEKPLSYEYIIPMERILETSFSDMISPQKKKIQFINKGIRYAASLDSFEEYQKLDEQGIIGHTDEYFKDIFDYIIDYDAINGIRYLAEKKKLQLDFSGNLLETTNGPLLGDKGKKDSIFELICKSDDAKLFEKVFAPFSRLRYSYAQPELFIDNGLIKAIISTKNIFNSLFNGKVISLADVNKGLHCHDEKGFYVNNLLFNVANYLLMRGKEYPEQVKSFLMKAIELNKKSLAYFNEHFKNEVGVSINQEGFILVGQTLYGNIVTTRLESQPDLPDQMLYLLNDLNQQIKDFNISSKPLLGGYSDGDTRLENGNLVKISTHNQYEYDFLKLMEQHQVSFVPRLLKQEKGYDYFSYIKGFVPGYIVKEPIEELISIVKALKTINMISKEALGNGKVYVHDDFSVINMVFDRKPNENNTLIGIIDWDTTKIGEEYEDLIYLIWTGLNIGDHDRNSESIFLDMKTLLKEYGPSKEMKTNWADKMIQVMDSRLKRSVKQNYKRIFEWIGWSKVFVELYRDRIKEEIG